VARLLRSVSAECRDGRVVNLSEKICRMMNDVGVRAAIGGRCEHRDDFLHELDEAVRLTGGFNLAELYPSSRLVRRFSAAARDMGRARGTSSVSCRASYKSAPARPRRRETRICCASS
jgi:hypothetical protein